MKYKNLILLNCHNAKDCLIDLIENIFKFNEDVCIVINNGIPDDNLDDIKNEHIHVIPRNNSYDYSSHFFSRIPLHIDCWDYVVSNNIESEYVTIPSTNQLFIKSGFYDFMKNYQASYFGRIFHTHYVNELYYKFPEDLVNNYFKKYFDDLGSSSFLYHSNHDSMFFTFDIFSNMMKYFEDYKGQFVLYSSEEFLYPAYLVKNVPNEQLAEFSKYNYFELVNYNPYDPNDIWNENTLQFITPERVDECISKDLFIVKRVNRDYNDPGRQYIRSLT